MAADGAACRCCKLGWGRAWLRCPSCYLRALVFDTDSALVAQPVQPLSQAANGGYEPLRLQVLVPQDGYVTAYVGNESEVDVYFDDVTVEHRPGLQVQETQYDPAGLELAGLAAPSPGIRGLNNYRFNGKEFQADLGLAWNHQDWRFFDPQLLRWHSVDPELENNQESWTPYSFGYDNAVRYADANGRCPCEGDLRGTMTQVADYASGIVSAVADDVFGTSLSGGNPRADTHRFQLGEQLGHQLAFGAGAYLAITGGGEVAGGGIALATAGGAEVITGGAATPVAAPTAAVGAGMVVEGSLKVGAGLWLIRNAARPARRTADNDHGNKLNDKPAEGYTLRDADTGEVQKYGETTKGERQNGAGKQKRYSPKKLESTNSVYQQEAIGTKTEMHKWQTEKIREHKANNGGSRPSLNKSDY